MNGKSVSRRSVSWGGLFAVAVLGASILIPVSAFAQTTSVKTSQLLPPGQNICQVISVTNVQPYVYGGQLESFDVTISDNSTAYVGIIAQVGNTPIPLNFITRWAGSPSGLRIHVDTPDIPVGSGLPVNLTLLASLPGQPTCITTITFDATGSSTVSSYTPPAPSSTSGKGKTPAPSSTSSGSGTKTISASTSTVKQATSSSAALTEGVSTVGTNYSFNLCVGSNAYRLWFILLAIYVVIVGVVVFAEPWFLQDSVLGSTASILVPLILLLLFWYLSEACRAASWIPVIACVIAIIGLFLALREYETPPLLAAASTDRK